MGTGSGGDMVTMEHGSHHWHWPPPDTHIYTGTMELHQVNGAEDTTYSVYQKIKMFYSSDEINTFH